MQVQQPVEKLEQYRPDHGRWNRMSLRLGVVMNDLEQVMLGIFEHHEDALVFQNDFLQLHNVWMVQLRAQGHFPNGRLRQARVLNDLSLFVRLESGTVSGSSSSTGSFCILFDGELPLLTILPDGLVNTAICATADEANDMVFIADSDLAGVSNPGRSSRI